MMLHDQAGQKLSQRKINLMCWHSWLKTPRLSVRTAASELNILKTSVQRLLKQQKLHLYKCQFHHELNKDDFDRRIQKIEENADFQWRSIIYIGWNC